MANPSSSWLCFYLKESEESYFLLNHLQQLTRPLRVIRFHSVRSRPKSAVSIQGRSFIDEFAGSPVARENVGITCCCYKDVSVTGTYSAL